MNILLEKSDLTRLMQSHIGFSPFNYDICVDWAVELLEKNVVSDSIQMLSSFSKPTDAWEIKPYVSNVLKEYNLEEFKGEKAIISQSYYYVWQILNNTKNLIFYVEKLYQICINSDYEESTYPFYLLKYSWEDLEDLGMSCHYQDVTFSNFNETLLKEANIWMENFEDFK